MMYGAFFLAISIHALCEEGDTPCSTKSRTSSNFYPRPLRGGRRLPVGKAGDVRRISIHALCEEGDTIFTEREDKVAISIHALCEEGDESSGKTSNDSWVFLSTPSARRATSAAQEENHPKTFLSTPSARRATYNGSMFTKSFEISIHALCEEGDSKNRDKISIFKQIIQHSARI